MKLLELFIIFSFNSKHISISPWIYTYNKLKYAKNNKFRSNKISHLTQKLTRYDFPLKWSENKKNQLFA